MKPDLLECIRHQAHKKAMQLSRNYDLQVEDVEQELILITMKSLENFDITTGFILSYTKNIIQRRAVDLIKFHLTNKRRCNLNYLELKEDFRRTQITKKSNLLEEIDFRRKLSILPKEYQELTTLLLAHSKKETAEKLGINVSKLNTRINRLKKMIIKVKIGEK